MPTILRVGPYRFFFYSNEGDEPPHIHVQPDQGLAKLWLAPVALASSVRFTPNELRAIERLVTDHRDAFQERWLEYFGQ